MNHSTIALANAAEMLDDLLSAGHAILLSKDNDGLYTGNAGRKHSAATSLEGCIEELTLHPRRKVCLRGGCISKGVPKPLWLFSPDKDSPDGHQAECKTCASKRVGEHVKKRKASIPVANHKDQPLQALPGVQAVVEPHMGEGLQNVNG